MERGRKGDFKMATNWNLIERYCGNVNPVEVFAGKAQGEIRAAIEQFNADYQAANNEDAFTADEMDEIANDIFDLVQGMIFSFTDGKQTMEIVFTQQEDGRIFCSSADHAKMIKTFAGLDEIIYAESKLFDDYDFDYDNGEKVVYAPKA